VDQAARFEANLVRLLLTIYCDKSPEHKASWHFEWRFTALREQEYAQVFLRVGISTRRLAYFPSVSQMCEMGTKKEKRPDFVNAVTLLPGHRRLTK
jgi:hypothetical protein